MGHLGLRGYGNHKSPYERDIFVLELSSGDTSSLQKKFASAVHDASGFRNSLVAARNDTGLVFPGLIDRRKMDAFVGRRLSELKIDKKGAVFYSRDLVPVIVDAVEMVLGK
jgi:hypothetical protein